jgi:hypothetical protein
VKKIMTGTFPGESELVNFIRLHLEDLYEAFYQAEQEGDDSLMDYVQGSIDTTHVYLVKSGLEKYMSYEEFLDIATAEWKKV